MLFLNGVFRANLEGRVSKLAPPTRARCTLYVVKNGSSIHFVRRLWEILLSIPATVAGGLWSDYLLIGTLRPENLSLMRSAASENSPSGFSTQ